jgi:hypothetical protein
VQNKIIKLKITYKSLWFAYDSNKIALLLNFIKKQKFKILRDLKEEKSFYLKSRFSDEREENLSREMRING